MKLSKLLEDLTPAQQAHQKGYASIGYGRWAKNGKHVADTDKDKLIPYSPEDDTGEQDNKKDQATVYPKDNPAPKPTGTSAKDAGLQPSNVPSAKDTAKINGTSKPEDESASNGNVNAPPAVPVNPHQLSPVASTVGAHLELSQIDDIYPADHDPHKVRKPLVIGETPLLVSAEEYGHFAQTPSDNTVEMSVQMSTENIADMLKGIRIGEEAAIALSSLDKDTPTIRANAFPQEADKVGVIIRRAPDQDGQYARSNVSTCINVTKMFIPKNGALPGLVYVIDLQDKPDTEFQNNMTEVFYRYRSVLGKY